MIFDRALGQPPARSGTSELDLSTEEDPRRVLFRDRRKRALAHLEGLFSDQGNNGDDGADEVDGQEVGQGTAEAQPTSTPAGIKRPARVLDEDDYGDDDEDDDGVMDATPSKSKLPDLPPSKVPKLSGQFALDKRNTSQSQEQGKTSEDARKKLEQEKKAQEEAAKRSSFIRFYTLENDRDAMVEQQQLDELDRQVEKEMNGSNNGAGASANGASQQQGTLSSTNLGVSSLTLKHLISKIDSQRGLVKATDSQLRSLMKEVRKGGSKWRSDDKIGQEELYEAAERVLMELKSQAEYATPFLQKVNRRDVPDYYTIIKHPMDIGTMLKKLKNLHYKSKKDFVDDLNLIWSNCLKYNADPSHYIRKKALYMKKESEKLIPLIPDIVIKDRAEYEAEERRRMNLEAGLEGAEESDDEEPIMASRGRKAPGKGTNKGTSTSRKGAPVPTIEQSPMIDAKAGLHGLNAASELRSHLLRAGSDAPHEGSVNGFATPPPPGSVTPMGAHSHAAGSQADPTDVDSTVGGGNGGLQSNVDLENEDPEYRTWKQVTKKDRARISMDRNRLFKGDKLNSEEPALLRSRAGMRRWLRLQNLNTQKEPADEAESQDNVEAGKEPATETLAEGIEGEEENNLPDYYDIVNFMPEISDRLTWTEDSNGDVVNKAEESLRLLTPGLFTSPASTLSKRMDSNMRQMQETRKVVAKIGIVKQMQIQAQTYQNQFQKYDPEPFMDADVGTIVTSDDGPVMSKNVCRAALQRSVAKIFYHAGFEETQPAALDAVTDIASDMLQKITKTLKLFNELPRVRQQQPGMEHDVAEPTSAELRSRYTKEEALLQTLHQNGVDLDGLDTYVNDDVERLGSKLVVMHERMKAHLADLLRPALGDNAGQDGVGAFNDGSEQFTGGDFAGDIDEDFFGFKELGLDKEFGLESLSVPFHLLQNRMHNAFNSQNASADNASGVLLETPPIWPPVTVDNLPSQIGLVQEFFSKRLHANGNEPLIEDEDLPAKQRFPKPRLPPTGKISSPRKRPVKEQQMMARKKRKLEEEQAKKQEDAQGAAAVQVNGVAGHGDADGEEAEKESALTKPAKKLKLDMPMKDSGGVDKDKDDVQNGTVGMPSPESVGA